MQNAKSRSGSRMRRNRQEFTGIRRQKLAGLAWSWHVFDLRIAHACLYTSRYTPRPRWLVRLVRYRFVRRRRVESVLLRPESARRRNWLPYNGNRTVERNGRASFAWRRGIKTREKRERARAGSSDLSLVREDTETRPREDTLLSGNA